MVRSIKKRQSGAQDTPQNHGKRKSRCTTIPDQKLFRILIENGFHFPENREQPNEIDTDQVLLQQRTLKVIKNDKEVENSVNSALEELWKDHYRFCFSLLPTVSSESCINSSRGKQQDSLIRILLGIDHIQSSIAVSLLEKLADVSTDNELASVALKLGDLDVVHRIVSQLRWLDSIIDSKDLLEKVFEIISISEVQIQQELIALLPDLVNDASHSNVVSRLKQLLVENSHLVTSILESLSNINLKGELLDQIRESVLEILGSADLSDLPIIVKFLQQSVTEQNALQIVREIREKLDFSSLVIPNHSSTPFQSKQPIPNENQGKGSNQETMIFDSIKSGLRFQKLLADTWLKVEESIQSLKEQKVVDIFVLFVLHGIKTRRKTVETLMRSKIKARIFVEDTITTAFRSHPQVFSEYLNEIILLSETFLRSHEVSISNYGCNIYKQAFCSFDTYAQQEVIGTLVTHIGSGYGPEIESSFLVLRTLVDEQTDRMKQFTIFLKGILDYIDNLSISQMRILFSMISKLNFTTSSSNDGFSNDDMYVLIRKQLSSPTIKYKRIGVIGAMMIIANIAKKKADILDDTTMQSNLYEQVISLLTLVQKSVQNCPKAASLFYDEFANIIVEENIDEKVLEWIGETVVSHFQDEFLIDADTVKTCTDKQLQLAYDLDEQEEGGISVNILPLILSDTQTGSSSSSSAVLAKNKLITLSAQFRLIQICERKQNNGNLEGINALLGCPLVLFNDEVTSKFAAMKEQNRITVCLSLIYSINWMRELLNAFTDEAVDDDTRGKIISRVKTLNSMNNTLEKCLSITKNFDMPLADFSIDDNLIAGIKSLKTLLETKQFKKPKKITKSKKKAQTSPDETEAEERNSDKDDADENDTEGTLNESVFTLAQFPGSFRELDLKVFYSLAYGSSNKVYMDSEMHTKTREEIKLSPGEVTFLLTDFQRKLEHCLCNNTKRTFLKQSVTRLIGFSHLPNDIEIIKFTIKILPSLCDLLKQCRSHFQKVSEEFDGVVDCPALQSEECKEIVKMYQLLLNIFLQIFQWSEFGSVTNKKLLHSFLKVLVKHTTEGKSTIDNEAMSKSLLQFFACSVELLPNIHIAVKVIKILLILSEWSVHHKDEDKLLPELLNTYLRHTWMNSNGEKDKGNQFNEIYAFLVKIYITRSHDPLNTIQEFCKGPVNELMSNNKKSDDGTEQYPCLTKQSFSSFYRCFFEELIARTKRQLNFTLKIIDMDQVVTEQLNSVQISMKVFQQLNSIVKEMDTRSTLITSLKYSRLYLEVFLKQAMPLLDKTLRTKKDLVHGILKSAQQSTRSLQHLCGHSKFAKDISLTTHVPALKKCLETFVYRVKAMLAYNNCDSAFWLGNLKNRDLHGNEILSQADATSNTTHNTGENEEEEDESQSVVGEDNEECSESF